MNRTKKPLQLKTETLRALSNGELRAAADARDGLQRRRPDLRHDLLRLVPLLRLILHGFADLAPRGSDRTRGVGRLAPGLTPPTTAA
jgi:hypothetical protein